MVTKRRGSASLQSAIVQPDSPTVDDRQGIIDAAYGCLSEPHSGPISVAAILERAGLSTRAFYRHFASKDELFLAMLGRRPMRWPIGWTELPMSCPATRSGS